MLYVSVDCEASGPVPGLFNMVSVGAVPVRVKGGKFELVPDTRFYAELKPAFPGFNAEAMAVHGIPREKLEKEGIEPREAMDSFRKWVVGLTEREKASAVFVGHHAAFDWAYVNHYFLFTEVLNPFDMFPIDLKAVAFGRFGFPWPLCRKSHFQRVFPDLPKQDKKSRHRADYDAEFQAQIMCVLMNTRPEEVKKSGKTR